VRPTDIKVSYYREHTHAIASGVSPDAIMAELFAKETGTCKGTGGSMHIYDKAQFFQGGWALVAEQLPYAVGAARSILLDRERDPEAFKVPVCCVDWLFAYLCLCNTYARAMPRILVLDLFFFGL